MYFLGAAQYYVMVALSVAALGVEAWAFVDAATHRDDAYTAAGKRTKGFWLLVTGIAVLVGFMALGGGIISNLGFLGLLGVAAAGVYLADVRPALRAVEGRGRRSQGPYGPW